MKQGELLKTAKHVVELYYSRRDFTKSSLFSKELLVIGNRVLREDSQRNEQVSHRHYRIVAQNEQIAVAVGAFHLLSDGREGTGWGKACIASIVFNCREDQPRVEMLHISEKMPGRKYCLEDARERSYMMDEMDVFYLEAGHNRTKWHCQGQTIETTGTLKSAEEGLSDSFVRIHRGFIVNRLHVRRIGRCYVELDNGERLQIPVKKYVVVKEQLKKI